MPLIRLLWAQAVSGVIGFNGTLPWHLPEDLKMFRDLTLGRTVVMGRRTWDSLPTRAKPLPGRRNIVLSRTATDLGRDVTVLPTVEAVLAKHPDAWVIGGGEVFAAFLPYAEHAVVTTVDVDVTGDTWAPTLGADWELRRRLPPQEWLTSEWLTSLIGLRYRVAHWRRRAD